MNLRFIPNLITVLRIFLIPPIIWFLLKQQYGTALIMFAIAGFSDALDGYLARRNNWFSWWGSVLDPLADKLLQVSSYITLAWMGHLPVWLVVAIVARDIIIISGALAYHAHIAEFEAAPSVVSKLNTFLQIALVLMVILHVGVYALPTVVIQVMIWLVLASTLYSGLDYVYHWTRKAIAHKSNSQATLEK